MSDNSLEKKIGLSQGTIGNWRSGRNKVSTEATIKLAHYFNISADYLLCLTDEPTPLKQSDIAERPTTSTLSTELEKDFRFVASAKLYHAMPDEYKNQVYAYIFGVAAGLGINVKQILKK